MATSFLLTQSFYRLGTAMAAAVFAQEIPAPDPAHLSSWLVDAAALGAILLMSMGRDTSTAPPAARG